MRPAAPFCARVMSGAPSSSCCCPPKTIDCSQPKNMTTTGGLAVDHSDINKARILLADDDPRLLDSLGSLLKLYNYQVDSALGGPQAIRMLSETSYDVLLLDLRMPEINGHDVLRHRSEEHTSELQSRGHLVCRLLLEKKNRNLT